MTVSLLLTALFLITAASQGESVKKFFLTLYILVTTAITVTLLTIICRNS